MEKGKLVLQMVILAVLVAIIGVLGIGMHVVALVYPIILTFIGLKNGLNKAIISFIASLFLMGLATQSLTVLIIPLQYGILAMATAYMINKKFKMDKIVIYSAGLVFAMVLLHMGLNWQFAGINTLNELENSLTIMTTEQLNALDTENMNESDISLFVNLIKSLKDRIVSIAPVLLMISSAAIAYINYYISTRLARRSGRIDIEVPEFSKIILPRHVIKGLSVLMILSYSLKYFGDFNYQQLLDNVFVLVFVVALVEGVSLTIYLINNMKLAKVLKMIFIVVIVLSSFLNIVLFSIGIMDIVFDFRKLRNNQAK